MDIYVYCVARFLASKGYLETGQSSKAMDALTRIKSVCLSAPNGAAVFAEELDTLVLQTADALLKVGRFQEAVDKYREAAIVMEKRYGRHSILVASVYTNLGTAILTLPDSRGALALPHFERAASIYAHLGRQNTSAYAQLLSSMGASLRLAGDIASSLELYNRALAILRRTLPRDHPYVAHALQNIAQLQGQLCHPEAEASHLAGVAVARRSQVACAGPGCSRKLRVDGAPLDVCVNCRRTFYCGKACQTADWKAGHRAECKALIAETVERAGAAVPK